MPKYFAVDKIVTVRGVDVWRRTCADGSVLWTLRHFDEAAPGAWRIWHQTRRQALSSGVDGVVFAAALTWD